MPRLTIAHMNELAAELVARDSAFTAIVETAELCPFGRVKPDTTHFESLVRAVISQQISTAAARTIRGRLTDAAGGELTPAALVSFSAEDMQACGLYKAKVRSLSELAAVAHSGEIDFVRIAREPDDVIVKQLTSIFGIGRWTVEMFLMFQLGRIDIWPTGDLAVRRGWDVLHPQHAPSTERSLKPLGERFTGLRSVAAWYCWRAS